MRVALPPEVASIYRAVEGLSAKYPGRPFTPDGHLVGSIGEVIAAEALGLTLYPPSRPGHDAFDANGDVQIKMTAGKAVSMYACCERLVVLRVVSPDTAEIVYDGPGEPAWENAGPMQKNGQRRIGLSKLCRLRVDSPAVPPTRLMSRESQSRESQFTANVFDEAGLPLTIEECRQHPSTVAPLP